MNHVAVHDILESDFDAPITDETLKELGFEEKRGYRGERYTELRCNGTILNQYDSEKWVIMRGGTSTWKTIGGLKLLIEALKGDEE